MLEKTLESPLDCKEIQPVHPKGNQSWIFIGRTGAEAEALIFGHLMQRTDSLEKTLMLGRIQGRREGNDRGWDGWMVSLIQWTWVWTNPGDCKGQGSLAWGSSWRLQRVRQNWAAKHSTTQPELILLCMSSCCVFQRLGRWLFPWFWRDMMRTRLAPYL